MPTYEEAMREIQAKRNLDYLSPMERAIQIEELKRKRKKRKVSPLETALSSFKLSVYPVTSRIPIIGATEPFRRTQEVIAQSGAEQGILGALAYAGGQLPAIAVTSRVGGKLLGKTGLGDRAIRNLLVEGKMIPALSRYAARGALTGAGYGAIQAQAAGRPILPEAISSGILFSALEPTGVIGRLAGAKAASKFAPLKSPLLRVPAERLTAGTIDALIQSGVQLPISLYQYKDLPSDERLKRIKSDVASQGILGFLTAVAIPPSTAKTDIFKVREDTSFPAGDFTDGKFTRKEDVNISSGTLLRSRKKDIYEIVGMDYEPTLYTHDDKTFGAVKVSKKAKSDRLEPVFDAPIRVTALSKEPESLKEIELNATGRGDDIIIPFNQIDSSMNWILRLEESKSDFTRGMWRAYLDKYDPESGGKKRILTQWKDTKEDALRGAIGNRKKNLLDRWRGWSIDSKGKRHDIVVSQDVRDNSKRELDILDEIDLDKLTLSITPELKKEIGLNAISQEGDVVISLNQIDNSINWRLRLEESKEDFTRGMWRAYLSKDDPESGNKKKILTQWMNTKEDALREAIRNRKKNLRERFQGWSIDNKGRRQGKVVGQEVKDSSKRELDILDEIDLDKLTLSVTPESKKEIELNAISQEGNVIIPFNQIDNSINWKLRLEESKEDFTKGMWRAYLSTHDPESGGKKRILTQWMNTKEDALKEAIRNRKKNLLDRWRGWSIDDKGRRYGKVVSQEVKDSSKKELDILDEIDLDKLKLSITPEFKKEIELNAIGLDDNVVIPFNQIDNSINWRLRLEESKENYTEGMWRAYLSKDDPDSGGKKKVLTQWMDTKEDALKEAIINRKRYLREMHQGWSIDSKGRRRGKVVSQEVRRNSKRELDILDEIDLDKLTLSVTPESKLDLPLYSERKYTIGRPDLIDVTEQAYYLDKQGSLWIPEEVPDKKNVLLRKFSLTGELTEDTVIISRESLNTSDEFKLFFTTPKRLREILGAEKRESSLEEPREIKVEKPEAVKKEELLYPNIKYPERRTRIISMRGRMYDEEFPPETNRFLERVRPSEAIEEVGEVAVPLISERGYPLYTETTPEGIVVRENIPERPSVVGEKGNIRGILLRDTAIWGKPLDVSPSPSTVEWRGNRYPLQTSDGHSVRQITNSIDALINESELLLSDAEKSTPNVRRVLELNAAEAKRLADDLWRRLPNPVSRKGRGLFSGIDPIYITRSILSNVSDWTELDVDKVESILMKLEEFSLFNNESLRRIAFNFTGSINKIRNYIKASVNTDVDIGEYENYIRYTPISVLVERGHIPEIDKWYIQEYRPFYYKLENFIDSLPMESATAQQWQREIKRGGIKKSELDYSGILSFLDASKSDEKISKDDILMYAITNRLRVKTYILEETYNREAFIDSVLRIVDRLRIKEFSEEVRRVLSGAFAPLEPLEIMNVVDMLAEYRYDIGEKQYERLRDELGYFIRLHVESELREGVAKKGWEGDNYRELFVTAPDTGEWRDGHHYWLSIRNPIIRAKLFDIQDAGKKILYIDEIQLPKIVEQRYMPSFLRDNAYEMGLKRIVKFAADGGYDAIRLSSGEEQAKRWYLQNPVNNLSAKRVEEGLRGSGWEVRNTDGIDNPEYYFHKTEEDIAKRWGEETARNLVKNGSAIGEWKWGGDWIYELYDKRLPTLLNKIGKEYGLQVSNNYIELSPDIRTQVSKRGFPLFSNVPIPEPIFRLLESIDLSNIASLTAQRVIDTAKSIPDFAVFTATQLKKLANEVVRVIRDIVNETFAPKDRDILKKSNNEFGAVILPSTIARELMERSQRFRDMMTMAMEKVNLTVKRKPLIEEGVQLIEPTMGSLTGTDIRDIFRGDRREGGYVLESIHNMRESGQRPIFSTDFRDKVDISYTIGDIIERGDTVYHNNGERFTVQDIDKTNAFYPKVHLVNDEGNVQKVDLLSIYLATPEKDLIKYGGYITRDERNLARHTTLIESEYNANIESGMDVKEANARRNVDSALMLFAGDKITQRDLEVELSLSQYDLPKGVIENSVDNVLSNFNVNDNSKSILEDIRREYGYGRDSNVVRRIKINSPEWLYQSYFAAGKHDSGIRHSESDSLLPYTLRHVNRVNQENIDFRFSNRKELVKYIANEFFQNSVDIINPDTGDNIPTYKYVTADGLADMIISDYETRTGEVIPSGDDILKPDNEKYISRLLNNEGYGDIC